MTSYFRYKAYNFLGRTFSHLAKEMFLNMAGTLKTADTFNYKNHLCVVVTGMSDGLLPCGAPCPLYPRYVFILLIK